MKKFFLMISMLGLLAAPTTSQAAAQVVIAPPGSQLTGVYVSPTTVSAKAGPVVFVNLDAAATGQHNIKSDAFGPNSAPWCGAYPSGRCPLFVSALVGMGGTSNADLRNTVVGESYGFTCTLHPNMRGTLQVVA